MFFLKELVCTCSLYSTAGRRVHGLTDEPILVKVHAYCLPVLRRAFVVTVDGRGDRTVQQQPVQSSRRDVGEPTGTSGEACCPAHAPFCAENVCKAENGCTEIFKMPPPPPPPPLPSFRKTAKIRGNESKTANANDSTTRFIDELKQRLSTMKHHNNG